MMSTKTRKNDTEAFKAKAVELMRTGKPVSDLAGELCENTDLLYRWRRGTQVGSEGKRAAGCLQGESSESVFHREAQSRDASGRIFHRCERRPNRTLCVDRIVGQHASPTLLARIQKSVSIRSSFPLKKITNYGPKISGISAVDALEKETLLAVVNRAINARKCWTKGGLIGQSKHRSSLD